jgi:dTDP-4-amino-4,6-dideoxygalactose transaminase
MLRRRLGRSDAHVTKPSKLPLILEQGRDVREQVTGWTALANEKVSRSPVDNPSARPKVRLMQSVVGEKESAALARIIEDGYLGMGAEVLAFEQDLTSFMGGAREVVCVSTCTAALHLALQACGIGPGDEVLAPSLTFVATFQAISATGATPVACEVDPTTGFIDVAHARSRITARTRAIVPVHLYGITGDLGGVYSLAREHRLRVVEDAAQAFGCRYHESYIGSQGDIVCFSFDGVKQITAGEGGAIVTSDPSVAGYVKDARLLAVQRDSEMRYTNNRSWEFDVVDQGYRFHMSNLMAAIGRVQLQRFETEFKPRRIEIAKQYERELKGQPGLRIIDMDYSSVVPFSFPLFIGDGRRDEVRAALLAEGIETGIQYMPNHLLSKYRGGNPALPVTERLYAEQLSLPMHPLLTEADQARTVELVRKTLAWMSV